MLFVAASVLVLVGMLKKNSALRSTGLVVLGIAALATPLTFYLNEVGSSWEPSSGDLLIIAILAFLGGISTAVGALTFRKRA